MSDTEYDGMRKGFTGKLAWRICARIGRAVEVDE